MKLRKLYLLIENKYTVVFLRLVTSNKRVCSLTVYYLFIRIVFYDFAFSGILNLSLLSLLKKNNNSQTISNRFHRISDDSSQCEIKTSKQNHHHRDKIQFAWSCVCIILSVIFCGPLDHKRKSSHGNKHVEQIYFLHIHFVYNMKYWYLASGQTACALFKMERRPDQQSI